MHRVLNSLATADSDRVAVRCGSERVTAGELQGWACAVANMLADTASTAPCALLVGHSPAAVAAICGAVLAGRPFLPLDPEWPEERLRWVLEDAGALTVLIGRTPPPRSVISTARVRVIDVEALRGRSAPQRRTPPPPDPEAPAYLLYTSGSTGTPKAVVVPGRAVDAYLAWACATYPCGPGLAAPLHSSLAFDLTLTSVLVPLATGGAVVIPRAGAGVEALAELLVEGVHDFGLVKLTPAHLDLLARLASPAELARRVRAFVVGGEQLHGDLVRRWKGAAQHLRVFNEYGPTEATVGCLVYEADGRLTREGAVPIGRPMPGTTVRLVEAGGRDVECEGVGELLIGGAQLALGYHGRADLTSERFVEHPAGSGTRWYRTGDLVRRDADGVHEFIGRADRQVKIRGYRVEPGEIEARLREQPGVRAAVVRGVAFDDADHRLVAYLVGDRTEPHTEDALRSSLSAWLPRAALPSHLVWLEALPLTANGKVDLEALPLPDAPAEAACCVDASSDTERRLAILWGRLLRVGTVSRRDTFVALGGHSLLAARLASEIQQRFGRAVSLRDVLAHPELARQARLIDQAPALAGPPPVAARSPVADDTWVARATSVQTQIWLADQAGDWPGLYHVPLLLRGPGRLDPSALALALQDLAARHGALRVGLAWRDGELWQRVSDDPVPLDHVIVPRGDWAGAPWHARLAPWLVRRLPVEVGPLVRARVFERDDGAETVLGLVFHHAIFDGGSVPLVLTDLDTAYAARRLGHSPRWPEATARARDAARQAFAPDAIDRWRTRLAGAEAFRLVPDRAGGDTRAGAETPSVCAPGLAEAVRRLAVEERCTPFMVWLGALAVVLGRHGRTTDVIVGTPFSLRGPDDAASVGHFANLVPLRIDLGTARSARDLLHVVRDACLDAYDDGQVPFDRLVEALAPARVPDQTPWVSVVLSLGDIDHATVPLDGRPFAFERAHPGGAKFDLSWLVAEHGADYVARCEFRSARYSPELAACLNAQVVAAVQAAVEHPDDALEHLVAGREPVPRAAPRERGLAAAFLEQVAKTPGAAAVSTADGEISYADLAARGGMWAARLHALGVGRDTPVAVLVDRSLAFVEVVAGIVLAGGAYAPLDAWSPPDRVAWMLDDLGPVVILATTARSEAVPERWRDRRVLVDAPGAPPPPPAPLPAVGSAPSDLAYLMYTSGSTGRPRAVAVEQRNVVSLVEGLSDVGLGPGSATLLLAPVAFDASTFELWGALLTGGRVVIAEGDTPGPADLTARIAQSEVTTLWLTATLFNLLVDAGGLSLGRVRQVITGGEALSVDHVRRAQACWPGVEVVNGYGPTETTTFATTYRVPPSASPELASIPIGRPLATSGAYVLDERRQPVPDFVPGELYVGGGGVARGYWKQPDLSAERFLDDPWVPGGRMYRTGDLVRRAPGGTLEFLGRLDGQIKLRGYRIEPGEIETALRALPQVRDARIVLQEPTPGDRRLVAILIAAGVERPSYPEIRAALLARLPSYMVPSAATWVDAFPLTSQGKLDRQALPAVPLPVEAVAARQPTPPQGETEARLAAIWARALDREVGVEDNFFDVGGSSLQAIAVMDAVQRSFGIRVPLSALLEVPTIRRLAARLRERGGSEVWSHMVAVRADGQGVPFFLVHHGGGTSFGYARLARHLPGLPVYAFNQPGFEAGETRLPSIQALAAAYLADVRTVQPTGPYRLGGFCFGGLVAYEMAQQLRRDGQDVDFVVLIETTSPHLLPRTSAAGRHKNALARLGAGGRVAYLTRRAARRLRFEVEHRTLVAWRSLLRAVHRVAERFGLPQSARARQTDLLLDNLRLTAEYVPQPYSGRVVLVRAEYRDLPEDFGWNAVVGPGVQVRQVATAAHLEMLIEPLVSELATELRAALHLPAAPVAPRPLSRAEPVVLAPGRAGVAPLFLPHSFGGDLFLWKPLVDALPVERPVIGLPPPPDSAAEEQSDVADMAAPLVEVIERAWISGPVHLAGYSFSGMLAFEVARQLRERGREVGVLAMIDAGPADPPGRLRRAGWFLRNLPWWLADDILRAPPRVLATRLHRKLFSTLARREAGPGDLWATAGAVLHNIAGEDAVADEYRAAMQARLAALLRYVVMPFDGDLLAIRARARPLLHALDPQLGWGRYVKGRLTTEVIACNHDNILAPPHAAAVASVLEEAMRHAELTAAIGTEGAR